MHSYSTDRFVSIKWPPAKSETRKTKIRAHAKVGGFMALTAGVLIAAGLPPLAVIFISVAALATCQWTVTVPRDKLAE